MREHPPGRSEPRFPVFKRITGFTLIELLVVIVIVSVLAAIALPTLGSVRDRAYFAAIASDFKQFTVAQEEFHFLAGSYAPSRDALEFQGTEGVILTVTEATSSGWSAVGTHTALPDDQGCAVYLGDADPPQLPNGSAHSSGSGVVECER